MAGVDAVKPRQRRRARAKRQAGAEAEQQSPGTPPRIVSPERSLKPSPKASPKMVSKGELQTTGRSGPRARPGQEEREPPEGDPQTTKKRAKIRRQPNQEESAPPEGDPQTKTPANFRRQPNHEQRTPLEDLTGGMVVPGTVKVVNRCGVFFDIGAQGDARLWYRSKNLSKNLIPGDVLEECHIDWVDTESRRVQVSLEDEAEQAVENLPPKPRQAQAITCASAAKKPAAKRRRGREAPTPKTPVIEDLKVGMLVDGTVHNSGIYGVFVDIGYDKDVRLKVPVRLRKDFLAGDQVLGMLVESVDPKLRRGVVSLRAPQLQKAGAAPRAVAPKGPPAAASPPPAPKARAPSASCNNLKQRPAAAASPPPAPKARAAATAAPASPAPSPAAKPKGRAAGGKAEEARSRPHFPPEDFKVGYLADGVVTNVTRGHVFVNIFTHKDGVLNVPDDVRGMFRVGDQVHGMTIQSVGSSRVTLTLPDPVLGVEGAAAAPPPGEEAKAKATAMPVEEKAAPAATPKAKAGRARRRRGGGAAAQGDGS